MPTMQIRLPEHMLQEIEAVRSARTDGADRAQVVRELINEGLKAQRRRKA